MPLLKNKLRKRAKATKGRASRVLQLLLKDQAISGKLLLLAAVIAIAAINSPLAEAYASIWRFPLSLHFGGFSLHTDVRHAINDGLMAIFFLVISLEIKREMVRGELRKVRAAMLPVLASAGGIALPIIIYMALNQGFEGFPGWGMPMTTDTAFAIGLLALLGRRVPTSLKIFLLTVVVIDDVAAIVSIAVFYTQAVDFKPLALAACVYAAIMTLHWLRFLNMRRFVMLGALLWFCIYLSGVHASIAGVILGFTAPMAARHPKRRLSVAERLEHSLIPVSTLVVIPLFALANAGVAFNPGILAEENALRVAMGVFLGLLVGKSLGIALTVWVITKLRIVRLPPGIQMSHITGVALLAGVGFTLAIFIAELAFTSRVLIDAAKIGIFLASIVCAFLGLFCLRFFTPKPSQQKPNR